MHAMSALAGFVRTRRIFVEWKPEAAATSGPARPSARIPFELHGCVFNERRVHVSRPFFFRIVSDLTHRRNGWSSTAAGGTAT
jgi:hypothetical protein